MNYGIRKLCIVLIAFLLASTVFVFGQRAGGGAKSNPAESKPTPRSAQGHPDLNGFWRTPRGVTTQQFQRSSDGSVLFDFALDQGSNGLCTDESCQNPNQPPYKPEYMAKVKEIAKTNFGGTSTLDPLMDCKPPGVPRAGISGIQIIQSPKATAVLYENLTYRVIYTDGRQHPQDLDHTYYGDSIGRWEGDTLIVDTVGFNDDTWLGGDVGGRQMYSSIHSDQMHVVERWTRKGDVITYEATVEDPVMFSKPWVINPRKVQIAKSDDYLLPNYCVNDGVLKAHYVAPSENDKDIQNKCASHRCDAPVPVRKSSE